MNFLSKNHKLKEKIQGNFRILVDLLRFIPDYRDKNNFGRKNSR